MLTKKVSAIQRPGMDIRSIIRTIPDYPKPGIMFRDITTLLGHAEGFRFCVDEIVRLAGEIQIDKVAGIEARGFILGGAVAHQLSVGFVPIRKKGKLPGVTIGQTYQLEYGVDEVEIHKDAVKPGERILLIDDLIATGGTAEAAILLIERVEGVVAECMFVIDLPDLGGADKLRASGKAVRALESFEGA